MQSIEEWIDATVGKHRYDGEVIIIAREIQLGAEINREKTDLIERITQKIGNYNKYESLQNVASGARIRNIYFVAYILCMRVNLVS